MTRVLEGTWEEIKLHDAELAGKQVRVTVETELSESEKKADIKRRLEAWERLGKMAVKDIIIDDTREGIYGPDGWRG